MRGWAWALWMALLAGCGSLAVEDGTQPVGTGQAVSRGGASKALAQRLLQTPASVPWEPFVLPGKTFVPFEVAEVDGRPALQVQAQASVSILRQRFDVPLQHLGAMKFSWRVDGLPLDARLSETDREDAPVRILLAFDGDKSRWSARQHRLSEMSRLLTGEPLPYATLMYVWSPHDAADTVVVNPRSDRVRKLVVETGDARVGQWVDYRRDVRADFIRVFGEEPGPLLAVALMTDTDNTRSQLTAWYGALRLESPLP